MPLTAPEILVLNWVLALPFFGALCVALFPRLKLRVRSEQEAEALGRGPFLLGALTCLMGMGLTICLFPATMGGGRVTADYWWTRDLYHLRLQADALSTMTLLVLHAICLSVHLHLAGLPRLEHGHYRAALALAAQGCGIGVMLSADLIAMFFFLETALVALWLLASLDASRPADHMLASLHVGGLLVLAGVLLMWGQAGDSSTFHLPLLLVPANPQTMRVIGLLVLLGLLPRIACVPGHGWVPALAAGTASVWLAPAVLLPLIGGHVLLRLLPGSLMLSSLPAVGRLGLAVGVVGLWWGGLRAWLARDLRQLAAWLTVAQSGYLVIALAGAVSPTASPRLLQAGAVHLLVGPLTLLAIWCAAGTVLACVGADSLAGLSGLLPKMPLAALALVFGGLSLAGMPPLAGFQVQRLLVSGLLEEGRLSLVIALLIGDGLIVLASLNAFRGVFLRREQAPPLRWASAWLSLALLLVVALLIVAGLCGGYLAHWGEMTLQRVLSIGP